MPFLKNLFCHYEIKLKFVQEFCESEVKALDECTFTQTIRRIIID